MSLYGAVLRKAVFPFADWWRRVPVGTALALMEQSQWWSPDRLRQLQGEKLRRLVASSYAHVPYYREMMNARGLTPADIRSVDDLKKLPLLTREALRNDAPERMLHRGMSVRDLYFHRTSGSSGQPLIMYHSRTTFAYDRASFYRFLRWCGVDRGEVYFNVWGRPLVMNLRQRVVRRLKLQAMSRVENLNTWEMTPQAVHDFIRRIGRRPPTLLRGYTSGIVDLARFLQKDGVPVPPIRAVSTTAEPLQVSERALLERVFRAPVFDQYGCSECNGMAYECSEHQGLHIAMEHCIVEMVDDQGEPVPAGSSGRIVLTNLDNEAFPFIRYVCGDESALLPEACSCGRGLALMAPVQGRTMDRIYGINGNRVWGSFLTEVLENLHWVEDLGVKEYQFVQTAADHLRLDLVSERAPTAQQLDRMVAMIREYLGPMRLDYRPVTEIARGASNKLRYAIREWQPADDQPDGSFGK